VVFESEMDLKAHQLSEHANSLSKDVRRDARHVDMSGFDFRQTYQQERRGGGPARESRGRGRDPNAEALPVSSAQPLRRDELAFQRQMAIHSAQSVSTRTFGGQLSSRQAPASASTGNTSTAQPRGAQQPIIDAMDSLSVTDLSSLTQEQRASLTRHGAVVERASNLLGSDSTKLDTFRAHISSYNRGSMTAEQLIDAFFALFTETSANALGTLVREVADLFEDKSKAEALRKAWNDWRAINEDYPSLPGLGGMHGATTSSSGWATAAAVSPTTTAQSAAQQKHSTRVLRLKNSTRRGSVPGLGGAAAAVLSGTSSGTGSQAFSRAVARPPNPSAGISTSSAAFPALPSSASTRPTAQPSWIGGSGNISSAASSVNASRTGTPSNARKTAGAPPGNSADAFPALPAAPKPLTTIFGYGTGAVRRDLGGNRDTGFSWGSGGAGSSATPAEGDAADADTGGGKGGKKKKKQVLVQWG
jgi:hypothetical protein